MTHPIPTSFRLRRRKWKVLRRQRHSGPFAGVTLNAPKSIYIYDEVRGRRRTDSDKQKTFWHEATHSVLFTMEHKLAKDEKFVTQFALLLEEMVRTARFEEAP